MPCNAGNSCSHVLQYAQTEVNGCEDFLSTRLPAARSPCQKDNAPASWKLARAKDRCREHRARRPSCSSEKPSQAQHARLVSVPPQSIALDQPPSAGSKAAGRFVDAPSRSGMRGARESYGAAGETEDELSERTLCHGDRPDVTVKSSGKDAPDAFKGEISLGGKGALCRLPPL